jgi:putative transposase
MNYIRNIHHRRSIRLQGYDYSKAGAYFITLCCDAKKCLLGDIVNGEMRLNEFGIIAYNEWEKLPGRFMNFELDVFQIMPNHIHGVIVLNAPDQKSGVWVNPAPTAVTVGAIVGAYKLLVAKACLKAFESGYLKARHAPPKLGKLWQRNYYEHIIRNEQSYQTISDYIISNPNNWSDDSLYMP